MGTVPLARLSPTKEGICSTTTATTTTIGNPGRMDRISWTDLWAVSSCNHLRPTYCHCGVRPQHSAEGSRPGVRTQRWAETCRSIYPCQLKVICAIRLWKFSESNFASSNSSSFGMWESRSMTT